MVINGNVTIERNFEHVENYYEQAESRPVAVELTDDQVVLRELMTRVDNSRQYFSICKMLMFHDRVPKGDFKGASAIITDACPDLPFEINVKDLERMDNEALNGDPQFWEQNSSGLGRDFKKYKTLAIISNEKLRKVDNNRKKDNDE